MAVAIDKRNGGCGVIFKNKLYIWGGNTTDKRYPYAELQLSSDSDSDDGDDDNGAPSIDPNLVIETAVTLPRPNDPDHPFDVLDLSTRQWSKQPTYGDFPSLGLGSSLIAYPPMHSLYLYSGWKDGEFDSEVYKIIVDEWKWEILKPATGVKPSPRYLTGVLVHGNHMSMFGGVGKDIVPDQDPGAKYVAYVNNGVERDYGWNNEYYEFDFYSGEWRAPLGKQAHRPDPIGTFEFTKFDHQRAIMFGGSGSNGRVNEIYIFNLDNRKWIGPLVPSSDQLWPIPTRFSTFTPLIDPDRVGKKLANGHGPVLQQKLMLLWGKATPQLICPDTWLLEIKESKEEERVELSWTRLYISLKPRSWHIARPVYKLNSTECDVVVFGGNVHIEGHYGDRDNAADLNILTSGVETLVHQCLSAIVKSDQLKLWAKNSMPPLLQAQINTANSLHQTCPKVKISSL